MDRRSWLWRRKSSPGGETESSGSLSSHSERFFDDQTNVPQSPEVITSLSDDIRGKEDLVKQHAKVAEEAVSGWERAEKEVLVLKKQNEVLIEKNLILEERVDHLDEALKECLRQLRQAREDNSTQLSELRTQLQNANAKLEAAENDKSLLKLQQEITSRERDLSTHAATKQHVKAVETTTSLIVPSLDIYLMDDFLEMERLVSLPEGTTSELEDTLKKITAEKARLENDLSESQIQLKASEDQLKRTEMKLVALANQAAQREVECHNKTKLLDEAEKKLNETNEAKCIIEVQLEEANVKRAESEAHLKLVELELETSISTLEKEKNASREAMAKCEAEISRIKSSEFRINQDKQVEMAATKFAQCQNTIASLGRQLKSLATLDDFLLDSDRQVVVV